MTALELADIAAKFQQAMDSMVKLIQTDYDPDAYVWTKHVSTGADVFKELQAAPWAHSKTVPVDKDSTDA